MGQTAIVTGASSGIGQAVSRMLCEEGYEVFGIGREYGGQAEALADAAGSIDDDCDSRDAGESINDGDMLRFGRGKDMDVSTNKSLGTFHPLVCDLLDTPELLRTIKDIRRNRKISMLVNGAGVGYYGLHEELDTKKIQAMVRTNLEVPMLLTQLLLRDLKSQRGYVINISSVTADQSNPHGCAYGATKAGLSSFSESLFEEARKYGVKVVNIQPDMTKTRLYRNADFCEGGEEESYLLPEEVAEALRFALAQREGMTVTSLTLRPQLHRIRKRKSAIDNLFLSMI